MSDLIITVFTAVKLVTPDIVAPENFVHCNPIENDLHLNIIRDRDGNRRDQYCQNAENEVCLSLAHG